MKYHGKEIRTKEGDQIIKSINKLLTFTENVNNIPSEIKALQRSVALLKQDISQIVRSELIRIKEEL